MRALPWAPLLSLKELKLDASGVADEGKTARQMLEARDCALRLAADAPPSLLGRCASSLSAPVTSRRASSTASPPHAEPRMALRARAR
jgi:hypothetical protein